MGNSPLLWKLSPQVFVHVHLQLAIHFIYHIQYTSFTIYISNMGIKNKDVTFPPTTICIVLSAHHYTILHIGPYINFFTSKYLIIAQLNDSYRNSNQQYLVEALGTPSAPKWSLYMHMYKYTFRFPQNLQKIVSTLPTWLLHVPMWHLQDYSKSIGPLPGRWLGS